MPARACLRSLTRCAPVHEREVHRAGRAWLRCVRAAGRARGQLQFTLCWRRMLRHEAWPAARADHSRFSRALHSRTGRPARLMRR